MKMFKAILGIGALSAIHYQYRTIQKPKLYYKPTPENQNTLNQLSILQKKFAVTPWLINKHSQIVYMSMKHRIRKMPFKYDRIDPCPMPDGATTEIAWLGYDLPTNIPTIILLHTITADTQTMSEMVEDLARLTGWRIALCLRRGHTTNAYPFTTFNIMGSVPDFEVQIDFIKQQLPLSPLYAVGTSAGTAVLAKYLGDKSSDTPIRAAFAYCPGYDLNIAFDRVHPLYDRYMAISIKKRFLQPYQQQLQLFGAIQSVSNSHRLREMQKMLYEFSGYQSYDDYLNACNPIGVFNNIGIPTMILNAEDDPICHIENAHNYLHLIEDNPYTILVTTRHGSHCAHYQGLRPRSWAHQLICDYILVMHKQLELANKNQHSA